MSCGSILICGRTWLESCTLVICFDGQGIDATKQTQGTPPELPPMMPSLHRRSDRKVVLELEMARGVCPASVSEPSMNSPTCNIALGIHPEGDRNDQSTASGLRYMPSRITLR